MWLCLPVAPSQLIMWQCNRHPISNFPCVKLSRILICFLFFFQSFAIFVLLNSFFLCKQVAQFDTVLSHLFVTHCFVFISTLHIPTIQYVFNQAPWGGTQSTHYCLVRQGVGGNILKSMSPAAGKKLLFLLFCPPLADTQSTRHKPSIMM